MRTVLFFPLALLKFLVTSAILAGAIWYFFPTPGLIAGGLLAIGSIGAAAQESREKAQAARGRRAAQHMQDELEGFDEAARSTTRQLA